MSITKTVPVYEERIICSNCGHSKPICDSWMFDRKCEVCSQEGCIYCMKPFRENHIHCYHLECCGVLVPGDENRPYFGVNQVMQKKDIVFGEKYRRHFKDGHTQDIIPCGFHYVQFNGDIMDYTTADYKDCADYLFSMGVESPYSQGGWEEGVWLERLVE